MKNLLFPIFILLFLFSSCHKEEIILDKKEVIDPPTEINNAIFSGKVLHDDIGVAEAEIFIYQKGEKVGKVVSGEDGSYSTESVKLEVGPDVTFEIISTDYSTKIRRLNSNKGIYNHTDFVLQLNLSGSFEMQTLDPGDTNLVKIFGTLIDENNAPLKNISCGVVWDVEKQNANSYIVKGSFDHSDEKGYFEILVPKNTYLYYYASAVKVECQQFCNINDVDTILFDFPLQEIGEIDNDIEVFPKKGFVLNEVNLDITGSLESCQNGTKEKGQVTITINTLNSKNRIINSKTIVENINSDGSFHISNTMCKMGRWRVDILALNDYNQGQFKEFIFKNGVLDAGIFNTCDDYNDYSNNLKNFTVGNLVSVDCNNIVYKEYTLYFYLKKRRNIKDGIDCWSSVELYPGHRIIKSYIKVNNIKIGNNTIDYFEIGMNRPWGFISENGELVLNVTKIENGYIYGTISGEVETKTKGIQPVFGEIIYHL